MEIERKFLVKVIPEKLNKYSKSEIEQSYISTDPVIRLRKSDKNFYLTIKGKGHMCREEFEMELNERQYKDLMEKVNKERIITKERFYIPLYKKYVAELDVYHGYLEGLLTVEVEFSEKDESGNFLIPDWFGAEVTYEKVYKNNELYLNGLPKHI